LRRDLWEMRDAIDHYKDAADMHAFQTKVDSQNYPPDLETLVNGVDVQGKKVKFLRKIPVDPMTGRAEWGLHSMQDDRRRTPTEGRAFSMCIQSPWERDWTAPNIPPGRWLAELARLAELNTANTSEARLAPLTPLTWTRGFSAPHS